MASAKGSRASLRPQEILTGLGLSREEMGRAIAVSPATIAAWEGLDQLSADEETRNRLAAVAKIAHIGLIVYGAEGLPVFIQTPLRALGNRTPLQEIMAGHVERVIEILAAEYEGLGF